jgi:uncharacterized protein (DUF983 family)
MRSWQAYGANRVAQVIGYSGTVGLILAGAFLSEEARLGVRGWIGENLATAAVLFALLMLLMIVPSLNLINWKCPRCGELFSYPVRTRRTCQNCGLTKFENPHTGEG